MKKKILPLRRNLVAVPYSVRPDRIERGIRILRALRTGMSAPAAVVKQEQPEFKFARDCQ